MLGITADKSVLTSDNVKASRKSHTVLSCLKSAGSLPALDFVGTIPPDSVAIADLKKVKK